jgi:23S rRNA pseudouridine955/2504/2580 synthase
VRADLPAHMAESLEQLAFDMTLGDALVLDEVKFKDTDEGKKRIAKNIAKSARKERKGERRSRASAPSKPTKAPKRGR